MGCGKPTFSASTIFRRPGEGYGIHDLADDSGLRHFYGVMSSCGINSMPALGMLNFTQARARCFCTTPIRTCLALAPAGRRLNEDWAIFFAEPADHIIRQAALNFGAFGDRRHDTGTLWLCHPRTSTGLGYSFRPGVWGRGMSYVAPGIWSRALPASLQVPLQVEGYRAFKPFYVALPTTRGHARQMPRPVEDDAIGPFRVNSDRVVVSGTSKPWLYGSGYRGITKAVMQLDMRRPLVSEPAGAAVAIDGAAQEWSGESQAKLPFTKSEVFFRHNDAALYIMARRPATLDRHGKQAPWKGPANGDDAAVESGDGVEVFLSDSSQETVLHLGVSAFGARYDAIAKGTAKEETKVNFPWQSAVVANDKGMTVEFAVPWATLAAAGIDREQLQVNVMVNQLASSGAAFSRTAYAEAGRVWDAAEPNSEAFCSLGPDGRDRCTHFFPLGVGKMPEVKPRRFTVRLHFAELEDAKEGDRLFDVTIQGEPALKGFDIVKAAGGVKKAVVREFTGIEATRTIAVGFSAPAGKELDPEATTLVSAMEIVEEMQE